MATVLVEISGVPDENVEALTEKINTDEGLKTFGTIKVVLDEKKARGRGKAKKKSKKRA